MTTEELALLAKLGHLRGHDHIWCDGLPEFIEARYVPGLLGCGPVVPGISGGAPEQMSHVPGQLDCQPRQETGGLPLATPDAAVPTNTSQHPQATAQQSPSAQAAQDASLHANHASNTAGTLAELFNGQPAVPSHETAASQQATPCHSNVISSTELRAPGPAAITHTISAPTAAVTPTASIAGAPTATTAPTVASAPTAAVTMTTAPMHNHRQPNGSSFWQAALSALPPQDKTPAAASLPLAPLVQTAPAPPASRGALTLGNVGDDSALDNSALAQVNNNPITANDVAPPTAALLNAAPAPPTETALPPSSEPLPAVVPVALPAVLSQKETLLETVSGSSTAIQIAATDRGAIAEPATSLMAQFGAGFAALKEKSVTLSQDIQDAELWQRSGAGLESIGLMLNSGIAKASTLAPAQLQQITDQLQAFNWDDLIELIVQTFESQGIRTLDDLMDETRMRDVADCVYGQIPFTIRMAFSMTIGKQGFEERFLKSVGWIRGQIDEKNRALDISPLIRELLRSDNIRRQIGRLFNDLKTGIAQSLAVHIPASASQIGITSPLAINYSGQKTAS